MKPTEIPTLTDEAYPNSQKAETLWASGYTYLGNNKWEKATLIPSPLAVCVEAREMLNEGFYVSLAGLMKRGRMGAFEARQVLEALKAVETPDGWIKVEALTQ